MSNFYCVYDTEKKFFVQANSMTDVLDEYPTMKVMLVPNVSSTKNVKLLKI